MMCKYHSTFLTFSLSASMALSNVFAVDLPAESSTRGSAKKQTEHAYQKEKVTGNTFCESTNPTGAEALITGLDSLNEDKFKKMDALKEKLNSEIAYLKIASETYKAKIDLLGSLKHVAANKNNPTAAIEGARAAFNSALTLSTLKLTSPPPESKEDKEAMYKKVCSLLPNACDGFTRFSSFLIETPTLRKQMKTLAETNEKSIPDPVSPKNILEELAAKPNLQNVINKNQTDDLLNCLEPEAKEKKNAQNICVGLFGDTEKAAKMMDAIIQETREFAAYLTPHTEKINIAVDKSKVEFDKHSQIIAQFKKDNDAIFEKETQLKTDYEKDKARIEAVCREKLSKSLTNLTTTDREIRLTACNLNAGESYLMNDVRLSINNSLSKLKEIKDESFNDNERFKAYLANKYLCHCKKEDDVKIDAPPVCYKFEGQDATATVYRLTDNVSDILKRTQFSMAIGPKCSTSAEDLKELQGKCAVLSEKENYKNVCAIVNGESQKVVRASAKDTAWEKINEDNWIIRDSSVKGGMRKVAKKKNWELIGEGLKPVIPNIVPIWFANYQMKNQIEALTQQAIAEKQYYHTMDTYTQYPWMFNMPYFQGNYFLPTMNTTSGSATNPGFNFSGSP